jgi:hypothetical protein
MRHVGSSWTVKGAMCLVAGAGATLHAGRLALPLGPRGPQRGAGAAGAAALPDYVAKQASKLVEHRQLLDRGSPYNAH